MPGPSGPLPKAHCYDHTKPQWLFKKMFFNVYLFLRERELGGRGRERETQNLKQVPGSELSVQSPTQGLDPQTMRL